MVELEAFVVLRDVAADSTSTTLLVEHEGVALGSQSVPTSVLAITERSNALGVPLPPITIALVSAACGARISSVAMQLARADASQVKCHD